MWRFRTRKSKASKNWHSKAMLVDFKKTRITMTNANASLNLAEDMATASEISAASASFDSM
jgi:hypothetical protein